LKWQQRQTRIAGNKGQLVTREQIADALWGKDAFVDVEQGINTAIRKE
jgi:DNA-binding response OmpR family regulator